MIDRTLLITVSGIDAPGVTSDIFEAVASARVVVVDMEQLVVRGHLTLAIALELDPSVIFWGGVSKNDPSPDEAKTRSNVANVKLLLLLHIIGFHTDGVFKL